MALTKAKASNILLTTPAASSNDVTPATTEYVTTALANMVDSAPSTLNTLNELAAALGDDANFSTTVTNSIAGKLPLAGGTMTGNIAHASDFTIDAGGNITLNAAGDIILDADGDDWKFHEGGTAVFEIKHESHGVDFLLNTGNEDWRFKGSDDGTTITALHLDMSDAGTATFNHDAIFHDSARIKMGAGTDFQLYSNGTNGTLEIATGLAYRNSSSQIAKMTSSGHLALGGSFEPISALHISGNISIDNSSNAPYIDFVESGDTSDSKARIAMDQISGTSGQMLFYTEGSGTLTERMRIDSSGNVGIGYSSPGQKLQVAEANNYSPPGLGSNGGHVGIFKIDSGVPKYGMITGVQSNGKVFQQVQRIDGAATAYDLLLQPSGGSVGIGTSTNFDSLNGRGNLVVGSGSGNEGITIYSGSDSQGGIIFADGTSGTAAYPGQIQYTHSDNSMRFYTNAGTERMRIRNTGTMYLSDPDSGNYVASFTSQVKANAINVGPYATFGTDYSGWGSCLGWNVRPKIGTTNSGFEAATGYYAAGASMVRMAGNTFGVTTWTASEIAQSNIGAGTTFISLASSGATTLGQNSGNLTDNYALKVQTSHGLGEQGSHNSSYYHHNTDRTYFYFSNACYASGGFHSYSDEKLKKNITTISGALDDVAKMNGVTFNWKDPETRGSGKTGKQFGVIAQNMLEVDPELPLLENDPLSPEETIETDESYYSMDYSRITPFLIEAIKELKEKLETAEARITELEG